MITLEQKGAKDIVIYYRTSDNVRKELVITNFNPYFYVKGDGEYKSFMGEKLKKIEVNAPKNLIYERKKYTKTYEADIQYLNRYLINRIETPIPKSKLRVHYTDIETNMSVDIERTPEPIISITVYDNYINKYVIFVWRDDIESKLDKTDEQSIYYFNNEHDMLNKYIDFVESTNPDILTAWNAPFDFAYIINRSKKLKLNINKTSPLNYVSFDKKYEDVTVKGRVVFDLLKAYKKLQPSVIESYRLDNVCAKELGSKKIKVDLKTIWNDIDLLIKYNKRDVELIVKLEEKLKLIEYFDEIRRTVGCVWDSVWFNSNLIDVMVLREAKHQGFVLPSKNYVTGDKFQGAYVKKPVPGIHDNVICLDLKSLYPSLMCQFCISNENLSDDGEIQLPNGVKLKNREGFLNGIIIKLWAERKKYKKLMFDARRNKDDNMEKVYDLKQVSYKFLVNSLWGYLGYQKSRLYKRELASSITLMARETIMHSAKVIESLGYEVIAGDTDSIYIKIPHSDKNKIIETGNKLKAHLNKSYTEFVKKYGCKENKYLEMEFEKINSKMFFSDAKKRYVYRCIWADGIDVDKISYIGWDTRRSDRSHIQKKVQQDIFEMLLLKDSTKKDVDSYVKKVKERIKCGDIPLHDIVIPQTITKDISKYKNMPAHVRGMIWSNKNLNLPIDIKIRMLWITDHRTDVVCVPEGQVHILEQFKIDYDKMFSLIFDNTLEKIYDTLHWNQQEVSLLEF